MELVERFATTRNTLLLEVMPHNRWYNEHLAGVLEQINFEVDLHSGPGAPVRPKMILHESRTVQIPIFRCFLSFAVVVET